ncbi:MAG: cyclic nucleotide-binding domain-containing protein [Proteobacteria bacterium]|nr:cyclic nucleotide-binding domain-containing protein [Pseudomonadota bacterium]MBU1387686.1 cyclic nucleotide-binding domain-containing protein [Pseudomonadota bacterium]MBU1543718.1 cyclic nucleotide-binding domain-containing protein [Pseudomonadota bacterium]MBU2482219.1 cyclic nucleotide-binding domain-containing protein [Pseudomonadota bacterium]
MVTISEDKLSIEKYVKYAQVLEKTKWASDFSWEDIRKICYYIHPVSAKNGAVVFKEGEKEESLGIIVKGAIDIYKQGDNKNKKLATLKSSQTFGEMALLDGEPRSATGIAAQDSIIFFISKDSLINLSNDHPKLGFQILWKISKLISQHLRKTTGQLVDYMEA